MIGGPGNAILAIIVIGVVIYKKAARLDETGQWRVRFMVISSLVCGWPLAYCVFGMSLPVAQRLGS